MDVEASTQRKGIRKLSSRMNSHEFETIRPEQKVLTPDEKMFLLSVERGDVAGAKGIISALKSKKHIFDINCCDPLGRSGLVIAIENENLELIHLLLESGIEIRDALLIAIREDYVDGVDALLRFEEEHHKPGEAYTWESVDQVTANFTPDMTPLILAAQRNNYEILKMLLDRGATIPMPHDVKCNCDECVEESTNDTLRFSLSRINAYKALSSPSLIALSSKDPILTAIELSNELKRLSLMESQFREDYRKLRKQVQTLLTGLVDQARTSYELEILLNHNPEGKPWVPGEPQTLERLKLAIDSNQKQLVTHPSVQQLLAAIWYEGLPGFKRKHIVRQMILVMKLAMTFPIYSLAYLFLPHSNYGQFAKKPFVKFICNSASYFVFLFFLTLASQRIEYIIVDLLVFFFSQLEWLEDVKNDWIKHERGSLPSMVELVLILWIQALIVKEFQNLYREGFFEYITNMWNLVDIFSYGAFCNWIGLRALSWFLVRKELWDGIPESEVFLPRDKWHPFDPYLLGEAMFGAGMISSFLKLVHIFSINPYLGPLQVSLGKMIIDIVKWLVLFLLVLFAFGCGLNQLLWYYADLEKQECYSLPGGLPDFENAGDSCVIWRRFANLWETSQSLFWAFFGLVELGDFELKGIQEFTRFWGLLMFGSYSVCNIIVLLNMLIAMMNNSYTLISERSDMEWKFARSRLWLNYFGSGGALAVPMNLIPMPRAVIKLMTCKKLHKKVEYGLDDSKQANSRYYGVVRCLVRRYITEEQRKSQDFQITEDDINEVRQDIRSFRYELINILKMNNMKTPNLKEAGGAFGRKSKDLERMIQKGFQLSKAEVVENLFPGAKKNKTKDLFRKAVNAALNKQGDRNWNEEVKRSSIKKDPIGSSQTSIRRMRLSFKKSMLARGNSQEEIDVALVNLNPDQLLSYNPLLEKYTPITRLAYAKFKSNLTSIKEPGEESSKKKSPPQTKIKTESETIQKQSSENKIEKVEEFKDVEKDKTKIIPKEKCDEDKKDLGKQEKSEINIEKAIIHEPAPKEQPKIEPVKPDIKEDTKAQTEPIVKDEPKEKSESISKEEPKDQPESTKTELVKEDLSTSTTKEGAIPKRSSPKKESSDKQKPPKSPKRSIPTLEFSQTESVERAELAKKESAKIDFTGAVFDPKGKSIQSGKNITGWI